MKLDDQKIKEVLLWKDYVRAEDMKKAEEFVSTHHMSLVEHLIAEKIITKDLLGQAVAETLSVPYWDLNTKPSPRELVLAIPEPVAKKYRVVLCVKDDARVTVATDNPEEEALRSELQTLFPDKKINIVYSLSEDIDAIFVHYTKLLVTRFREIIETQKKIAPGIIDEIVHDALVHRASDVHFDPEDTEVIIRFRIDGVLHEAGRIPKEHYENILNRIKVQAYMRIDEHFSAQDGAIRFTKDGSAVDLRVSVTPTLDGEKISIRVLSEYIRNFALPDLGISPEDQKLLLDAARKPFGMILITGPTGSGKTTTLYALLKLLNHSEVNITTIEDPVEYKIAGVNQIQVNPHTNLTFAAGLRSIIRQDPDIILVGEIRDKETAEIAVNAALTGHLLLSTFHANDASSCIPRLLEMDIEPFLLASMLEIIAAQRLVRRICESCRRSVPHKRKDMEKLLPDARRWLPHETMMLYQGKGCDLCNWTGYRGRVAIFEFIRMSAELQELVLARPSAAQIWELAEQQGAHSLFEDGIKKVMVGITTLEELLRVASPPPLSVTHAKREHKN